MTTILATTVAPAVPVQIKAAARVSVDRDSVPGFLLEPLPDRSGSAPEPLSAAEIDAGASQPVSTQPLAPSTLAAMLEVQERTTERGRLRTRWDPSAEAELETPAHLAAAVRLYGRRRAA
jgi:hypothetical protein